MKNTIQFKIATSIILFLTQPFSNFAQEVRCRGVITLTGGSFNGRTYVKEFKKDSILIETKVRGKNIYVDRFIHVHQAARVKVYSKFKHGRGAIKGAILGLGMGTFLGVLNTISTSEESYLYVSPLKGFIFLNVLTTPLFTLGGLVGGSRKSKKYIINGNLIEYNKQWEEMQHLMTKY